MKNRADLEKIWAEINIPKFRIKQFIQAVCREGADSYAKIKVFPQNLQSSLEKVLPIFSIKALIKSESKLKNTIKVLFETVDGYKIESVMMKYQDGRNSICISSQAGCQMGCKFCATGTLKFGRNLTYEEIFDQVLFFVQWLQKEKQTVSNIIFMGMGEPFMNYDHVFLAARLFNNAEYLNIGARKITISTCGLVDGINRFAEEPEQFNLALSLHAPNQSLREKIMPIAKRWKLDELLNSINRYIQKTNRRVSFEYVLLKGINDSPEIAKELAEITQNQLIHINLIPYNNTGIENLTGTAKEKIFSFQKILQNYGINATVRTTMGQDIAAACGQLANKS